MTNPLQRFLPLFRLPGRGWISIAVVGVALSAWAGTKLNQVALENSTIDSTTIGATTPAVANFSYEHVTTGLSGSSLPSQGAYLVWNRQLLGETDFLNHPGTGIGGYTWFNGSTPSVLMTLSSAGVLSPIGGFSGNLTGNATGTLATFQNALIYGSNSLSLTGTSGLNLAWNESSGAGESDFVNQQATGPGGFNWYNTGNHSIGTPIMQLSGGGNLTVGTVAASSFLGTLTGNASTATALAASPSNCSTGQATPGINAQGQSQSCETAVYAQKGTVAFTSQTFANSSNTYFTESFSLASTPAAGSVVKCTPQSDFGNEVQYSCWTSGATLYIKITHGAYNLPYTVSTTNVNYFIES